MRTLAELKRDTRKILEEIKELEKKNRKAEIGGTVEIAGITWRILDKLESGYFAIVEGFIKGSEQFDTDTNDWTGSNLRNWLNTEFREKLEDDIGEENLVEFERDLLSLDGQTEYGTCMDKVSLLTVDEYRKYRKKLPNTGEWWWLCTPWSTKSNGYEYTVSVVVPLGFIRDYSFVNGYGVRPVCIFSSKIFESES